VRHINIEIKARCHDLDAVRSHLVNHGAAFHGRDHQIDTYFATPTGRLKLREGNIENSLISYDRADIGGPKLSTVTRCETKTVGPELKEVLTASLPVAAVVDKHREIFFINNVKFHLDTVEDLGTFVEIEAIDTDGVRSAYDLRRQCAHFVESLQIASEDMIEGSYSDMLFVGDAGELRTAA
jgi:adenylate cyclase class 2